MILYFKKHLDNVEAGDVLSCRNTLSQLLKVKEKSKGSFGFSRAGDKGMLDFLIEDFLSGLPEILQYKLKKGRNMDVDLDMEREQEKSLFLLGMQFLKAVRLESYDEAFLDSYMRAGLDVNFQHPLHKMTALHYAAASNSRKDVRKLVGSGQCDFLILDAKNRLPHELATPFSDVSGICRFLALKENAQARNQGFADHYHFKHGVKFE